MSLKIVPTKSLYNQEAVDILEELLAEAKAGKLIGIACVTLDEKGDYFHRFTRTDDMVREIGAVARLLHVLQTVMDSYQEG
jgi:hypothetical protein